MRQGDPRRTVEVLSSENKPEVPAVFDVGFIRWFQSFSSPLLDALFLAFTALGSNYFYVFALPLIYWTVDRSLARRVGGIFMASMWVNGLVKELFGMPRPSPADVRVLSTEGSPGFPSGHAQGSTTIWGALALSFRRRWFTWVCVALIALISLSRLYLGAHFPGDVLGGLVLGLVFLAVFALLQKVQIGSRLSMRMKMLLYTLIPLLLYPLYQDGAQEQLVGFFIGFFTADLLTGYVAPFSPRVSLKRQVVKVLAGYAGLVALGILHALFVPVGLPGVFGYALIGVWIAIGAPALFRRLGVAGDVQKPEWTAEIRHNVRHYAWTALAVLVLVAGTSVYVHVAVPKVTPPPMFAADGVLIIGHRGAAGLAPENTLVSFETALAHGAHVLELDVHRTRDGEAVVIHDNTVDRTTNGSGRVADKTLAELKQLDAGYRFTPDGSTYPWRGRGVTIPTLAEVLDAFPEVPILIEIKEPDPEFVETVIAAVDAAGARERVMISSFHDPVVHKVRELAPDIATGTAEGEVVRMVVMQRLGLGALVKPPAHAMQVPVRRGIPVATNGLRRILRDNGMQMHVWTVNDEGTMLRLARMGVHGIITDYPDRLQRVLSLLGEDGL
jgi:glycerophosphoryl diester phosphodiesterase